MRDILFNAINVLFSVLLAFVKENDLSDGGVFASMICLLGLNIILMIIGVLCRLMDSIFIMIALAVAIIMNFSRLSKIKDAMIILFGKWYRWRTLARTVCFYNYYEVKHFPKYQNELYSKSVFNHLDILEGYISEDVDYYIHNIKIAKQRDGYACHEKAKNKAMEEMIPALLKGVLIGAVFIARYEVIGMFLGVALAGVIISLY